MHRYYELEAYKLARVLVATVYSATASLSRTQEEESAHELRRAALATVTPLVGCSPESDDAQYRESLERSLGEASHVASCIKKSREAGCLTAEWAESLLSMNARVGDALSHSVQALSLAPG